MVLVCVAVLAGAVLGSTYVLAHRFVDALSSVSDGTG